MQVARTPNGFLDQSFPLSLVQHRSALATLRNPSGAAHGHRGPRLHFFDKLPELFPHRPDAAELFASNVALAEETAFRNATLQGSHFKLALRALELDVGSLSGFDRAGVDAELFRDRRVRSNWLMNIDTGDPSKLFPRGPRLDFDDAVQVL